MTHGTHQEQAMPPLPKTAYLTLWFPKPSETFIYREARIMRRMGMPLTVYTMYDRLDSHLSGDMLRDDIPVERLGCRQALCGARAFAYWLKRRPRELKSLFASLLLRRWNNLEQTGENYWACYCGCHLARRFEEAGVRHIHACWANGPATAAWVASTLTGIPFSFTGRAGDIYPADSSLSEKIAHAAFARVDAAFNIDYLRSFAGDRADKVVLVRNCLSWEDCSDAPVRMQPPYHIMALCRFVRTKGLDVLLRACRSLADDGVDFRLTLAGSGPQLLPLKALVRRLKLTDRVRFPGFVPHDQVPRILCEADVFVTPSKVVQSGDRDGLPTVIMEALMHRAPVVATDVGGIREVVRDGETGRLIPQQDVGAMKQAILDVLGDRDRALAMAERGRQLILDLYDSEKNARSMIDLIRAHS
jgi:glycosyltransferase involved in cell wall biosynthesis